MKILLLADSNSAHTHKWVIGLVESGLDIRVFSFSVPNDDFFSRRNISITVPKNKVSGEGIFGKIAYFKPLSQIKRLITSFSPDIVHAHYATSYGLMGALSGHKRFCVSVWGSDIYDFPRQGYLQRQMVRFILKKASMVFSTSRDMAREASRYCKQEVRVIPFGINLSKYPKSIGEKKHVPLKFVTSKALIPLYNIPLVVSGFLKFMALHPTTPMELHLAGAGSDLEKCISLAGENKDKSICFYGRLSPEEMPQFFSDKHVLINVPYSESFGVSILEASASGMAIIATNAGGIPEVVQDGKTGILIDKVTEAHLLEAMERLCQEGNLINDLGSAGREFVERNYDFESCLSQQLNYYHQLNES